MSKKKTIRIWLYPFNSRQKSGYEINDIGRGGIKAVLTQNHLDIFVDDSIEHNDTSLSSVKKLLLKATELKDGNETPKWQFVIFQHDSIKRGASDNVFKDILNINKEIALSKDIITIANGSEKNSSNYAALYEAVQYFKQVDCKNLKGEKIKKEKRGADLQLNNFDFSPPTEGYDPIIESEPESQDDWKNFLTVITGSEGNFFTESYKVWAFAKNGLHYKLLDLTDETLLFKEITGIKKIETKEKIIQYKTTISDDEKLTDDENAFKDAYRALVTTMEGYKFEETKHTLNIILAPGDLTKYDYSEHLFHEILYRGAINIDDTDSVLKSTSKKNVPLLLICSKAGQEQNFYNASIWTRMVNIYKIKGEVDEYFKKSKEENSSVTITDEEKQNKLKTDIGSLITGNILYLTETNKILYQLEVAKEHFEFQTRLYKNSYLTGSHNNISPIIFHDEDDFRIKYEDVRDKELAKKLSNKPELIVFLIDDFAEKELSIFSNKNGNSEGKAPTKKQLLEKLRDVGKLKEIVEIKVCSFSFSPLNCKDKKFNELKESIETTVPDIILLDYNLGKDNPKGSEIFSRLIDGKLKHRGPFNKFWVFPITAFSNAFIDDMRADGLEFIDDKYELSRGADFISTPNLFKYYFANMVLEIIKIKDKIKQPFDRILCKIEKAQESKSFDDIREFASNEFNEHLSNKRDIDYYLQSKTGVLGSMKKGENIKLISQQLNFYEQLLYNLAYRNYESNEEIIIFYDLLKKSLNKR